MRGTSGPAGMMRTHPGRADRPAQPGSLPPAPGPCACLPAARRSLARRRRAPARRCRCARQARPSAVTRQVVQVALRGQVLDPQRERRQRSGGGRRRLAGQRVADVADAERRLPAPARPGRRSSRPASCGRSSTCTASRSAPAPAAGDRSRARTRGSPRARCARRSRCRTAARCAGSPFIWQRRMPPGFSTRRASRR